VLLLALLTFTGSSPPSAVARPPQGTTGHSGCTVLYAADEGGAYGGNNEDERNPLTWIWFVPGEDGAYGSAFVGYDDLVVQGGMNEEGLFFDALGVREVEVPGRPGKPESTGQSFVADVMGRCDSVDCVLERLDAISMPGTWNGQYLFGDRFGSSAIIEPLTVIRGTGRFQVATNFFQSEVPVADRRDERYLAATRLLDEATAFSVDEVRSVLEATRQNGTVNTVYSTIYELGARVVHLHYFGDFDHERTFDVRSELARSVHGYEIAQLFPPNEGADQVAAPIRARVAAVLAADATAGETDPAALEMLTGTYEIAPGIPLFIESEGGVLRARQPLTPWVDLAPASATEFVRVSSDGEGIVHEQLLRFQLAEGRATRIEITVDGGTSMVAVRSEASSPGLPLAAVAAGLLAAALAGAVALTRARRRHDSDSPDRARSSSRPSVARGHE
jgi:hypothetical protein